MGIKLYEHICDFCGNKHMISSTIYNRLTKGKQKKCYCSVECANEAKKTGYDIKCDNCGKMFYRRKNHIDRQNSLNGKQFCCTECEFEYKRKTHSEKRICEICGKEFECKVNSTQRFCSTKCQGKWQSTQLGELNPRYKHIKCDCKWCGKSYMAKRSKVINGSTNFCSAECRQAYYRNVICKTKEHIELHRNCALRNLEENKYSTINSEPQRILDDILNNNNIKFKREYKTKYYSIDNYLPDFNLMIEVMGDFWHCNPTIYDEPKYEMQIKSVLRDERKHDYIFEEYGIEILYLWEHDLKYNIEKCKKMILEYINNDGKLLNYHSFNYMNDVFIETTY